VVRFLADESCDFAVVRSLRDAGFDVLGVAETAPRASDAAVVEIAVRDGRVLVTEDKDFGQLVHASADPRVGVILLRFPAAARKLAPEAVVRLARARGNRLSECFAVVQPGRIRIARTPGRRA
jgi:predicted nuclease of predicted toxin-antitoxin system